MASSGENDISELFNPKQVCLDALLQLGITRNAAVKALFYTGNNNAELAAAWVFENEHRPDLNDPLTAELVANIEGLDESDDLSEDFLDPSAFHKMVFVVNSQLGMGVGKIAAQVGHAAIGLYRDLCENSDQFSTALSQWEQFGETKIVLKGENATQLKELQAKALTRGLATYLVHDAGHTQVAAGSTTVLGIMGRNDEVDQVTGSLSLL